MPAENSAPPAQDVAGPAAEQQQAAERQRVGVQHPGQAGRGEVQAGLDVRQGDVHHGRVKDDHELGTEHDAQRHTAPGSTPAAAWPRGHAQPARPRKRRQRCLHGDLDPGRSRGAGSLRSLSSDLWWLTDHWPGGTIRNETEVYSGYYTEAASVLQPYLTPRTMTRPSDQPSAEQRPAEAAVRRAAVRRAAVRRAAVRRTAVRRTAARRATARRRTAEPGPADRRGHRGVRGEGRRRAAGGHRPARRGRHRHARIATSLAGWTCRRPCSAPRSVWFATKATR